MKAYKRLGVGPAVSFLTFAWHALSDGAEPVFLYATNRAIKTIAKAGGLGGLQAEGNLEQRFRTFYQVARATEQALQERPHAMRLGWGVEHALLPVLRPYIQSLNVKCLCQSSILIGGYRSKHRSFVPLALKIHGAVLQVTQKQRSDGLGIPSSWVVEYSRTCGFPAI